VYKACASDWEFWFVFGTLWVGAGHEKAFVQDRTVFLRPSKEDTCGSVVLSIYEVCRPLK